MGDMRQRTHQRGSDSVSDSGALCVFKMVTGVVGHGRLLAVPLLLKLDVAKLEHSGHHLQHPCSNEEDQDAALKVARYK